MRTIEHSLEEGLQGTVVSAGAPQTVGVLVLAGSSGRVDVDRARLLARHGAVAIALRWFGGAGQPPGICEVPLETFILAIDWLVDRGLRHIGLVGVSKGAEGALLVACLDPRVESVVAVSPSSVSWANVGPGSDGRAYPYRSSWTWEGRPWPFVPYSETWEAPPGGAVPVAYRSLYEQSLLAFPEAAAAAAIPAEHARAELLLIAGADDAMWPSDVFAGDLADRRRAAGRPVRLVTDRDAGHRPFFPDEPPPERSPHVAHGGNAGADGRLGRAAWPHVLRQLQLA